ncbi:MAG: hypothetical protein LKM30_08455 [Bacilli bacterium]|jgi:hypothetical protein|nr:hypothetical protein [Bacilli bacterium]
MTLHTLYVDEPCYGEMISRDEISLLLGYSHRLSLKTVPEGDLSLFTMVASGPVNAKLCQGVLVVDLTEDNQPRDVVLHFQSLSQGLRDYPLTLHLLPPMALSSYAGTYRNPQDPHAVLTLTADGHGTLDTKDVADSLPLLAFTYVFDYRSLALKCTVPSFKDEEGTEFQFFLDISLTADTSCLPVALEVEAYNGEGSDSFYLIGDGDEDGLISKATFRRI